MDFLILTASLYLTATLLSILTSRVLVWPHLRPGHPNLSLRFIASVFSLTLIALLPFIAFAWPTPSRWVALCLGVLASALSWVSIRSVNARMTRTAMRK